VKQLTAVLVTCSLSIVGISAQKAVTQGDAISKTSVIDAIDDSPGW